MTIETTGASGGRISSPEHAAVRTDYADRFALATGVEADPEQWARAMFGDTPGPFGTVVWRGLLQLRLERRRSTDTVAGWRITARNEEWIRLEARSWFLSGNLIVQVGPGLVALTTVIRYDRFPARWWWPLLARVHRRLTPGVLAEAAERLSGPAGR